MAREEAPRYGWRSKELLPCLAVLLSGASLAWGLLLNSGIPWGHDASFHAQLANGMIEGLADGRLYPRWIAEANRGYGSPALVFYSPGSSYAAALLSIAAGHVTDAMRWVAVLSAIASGLAFYLCARDFARPRAAAAGASLYVLLPYHALDLYERFAFAEYNTFVWLPLVVYSLRRLSAAAPATAAWRRAWLLFALAYAGLVLTHFLVAGMSLFFIGPYVFWGATSNRPRFVAGVASAGFAAALLSAVYLVPLIMERHHAHTDHLLSIASGPWGRNFLFRGEQALGFAGRGIKLLAQWCLAAQLLVAVAAALMLRARDRRRDAVVCLALCGLAVLLQLPISAPLWQALPPMAVIVYPWRFQVFQVLFSALLVSWALERRPVRASYAVLVAASLPALVLTGMISLRPAEALDQQAFVTRRIDRHVQLEHMPRGVPNWQRFTDRRYETMEGRVRSDGPIEVEVEAWSSHERRLRLETDERRTIVLRTFAYPGWRADLDGRSVELWGDPIYHAISLEIPAGQHRLEVTYAATGDQRTGAVISLAALASALLYGLVGRRER